MQYKHYLSFNADVVIGLAGTGAALLECDSFDMAVCARANWQETLEQWLDGKDLVCGFYHANIVIGYDQIDSGGFIDGDVVVSNWTMTHTVGGVKVNKTGEL